MKFFKFFIPVLVFSVSGIAQENQSDFEVSEDQELNQIQEPADTLQPPVSLVQIKDSLILNFKDHPLAELKDSLWLKELYNSDLFEEMQAGIGQEFGEVEYEELSTSLLKQRLEELNARTPFRVEYNPSLENVIKSYLKNRRKTLQRLINLGSYYFPMFEETLDRYDLPLELKYLAVVESALNPVAKSRMGATGLWQFMFATGKMYGLEVNSYVDDRCDPIMATEAAAKYLQSLNNSFQDWDLALAAYNSGPGNVSKAIRRSGGETNYWKLRNFLPRETAGYVPAFLATMYIFEYAQEHGFVKQEHHIPYVATDTVKIKHQISLDLISELTGLDKEYLSFLNPSYRHGIIPVVKNKDYYLRLPYELTGGFVNNEEAIYAYVQAKNEKNKESQPELYDLPARIRYRVKPGDYLGKIAAQFGVGINQIKNWNGLRNNNLRAGQHLTIYPRTPERSVAASPASAGGKSGERIYTVRQGDSLWSISQKFPGVSVQNIKKWNGISGTNIKPGTKLKLYQG